MLQKRCAQMFYYNKTDTLISILFLQRIYRKNIKSIYL